MINHLQKCKPRNVKTEFIIKLNMKHKRMQKETLIHLNTFSHEISSCCQINIPYNKEKGSIYGECFLAFNLVHIKVIAGLSIYHMSCYL